MYDIVGEDQFDIVGEEPDSTDVSGEVGFGPFRFGGPITALARRAPMATARPVTGAVATPSGATVIQRAPTGVTRRQILPIPATSVAGGGQATITLQPQRHFRVERLVLASNAAPSAVVVSDISVGAEREFLGAGDVPIAAFAADAVGTGLRGNTASPGVTVSITLRNLGTEAEQISGAFFGTSLE